MSPSLGISSKLNKLLSSRKREREPPETIDKEKERKSRDGHRTNSSTNSSPGKSPSPSPSPSTQPDQTILRVQLRRAESSQVAAMKESEEERNAYGEIDWDSDYEEQIQIQNISSHLNQTIHILARIHTIRAVSSSLVFIVFRQQLDTIQGVLSPTPPPPSSPTPHMIHWASRLNPETIVHVKAIVQKPNLPKGGERIEGTSVHDVELRILELHVLSRVAEPVPFTVYDADISAGAAGAEAEADNEYDGDKNTEDDFNNSDSQSQSHPNPLTPYIPDRSRIASRIIHLRSLTAQSTFRIQSTISTIFRTHLADLEYVPPGLDFKMSLGEGMERELELNTTPLLEIHTPKLQGGASESGASVFKLKYFGRTAFLAQSPQLFKQMSIAADYGGVYEVGPVFRAENSNTKRHLTEYTGLDLEMMVRRDYHEVMLVVDSVLKAIFEEVYTKRRREVDVLKAQFPTPDLVWLPKTPVIAFADGIQMLIDSGWTDPSSQQPPLKNQDLSTRAEIQLGKLIKEKYNTDYYILDLFPKSARPFYTMPASTKLQKAMERKHGDSLGGLVTSSFDIFVRGQEITTGGQRIHDYGMLVDAMAENDISARGLEEYLDGFRWGAPPHGGAGIGLERLLMLVLGLNDIRNASMYPRDPKSLPEPPKALEGIRHPEADTLVWATGTGRATGTGVVKCICQIKGNTGSAEGLDGLLGLSDLSLESTTTMTRSGVATPATVGSMDTTGTAGSKSRHPPHHVPSPLYQSLVPGQAQSGVGSEVGVGVGSGSGICSGIISSPSPSSSFPPVPSLIANYGDAANTSWLDDRYLVWRDPKSGAAVGFVPSSSGFAIIVGDPLCDKSQTAGVVARFLAWLRRGEKSKGKGEDDGDDDRHNLGYVERKTISPTLSTDEQSEPKPDTTLAHSKPLPPLKPIWLLASSHLESVLGSRLGWSSFTCIAESRVELEGEVPGALDDKEVGRKIRKAESEGIEVGVWAGRDGFTPTQEQGKEVNPNEYDNLDEILILSDDSDTTKTGTKAMSLHLKHQIDDRIKEWREGRRKKGGQVRLTEVEVWRDSVHRQYFVALAPRKREGGEGKEEGGVDDKIPVALVVLHQLSPMYGFQVKYALDFPSSLSTPTTPTTGAIESALTTAMHSVASTGSGRLTFGTSATSRLTPTRGVGSGMRVKILGHAYEAIAERMALRGKGEFRKKMGAEEEDVYVCYPRGGLGTRGVKAVLDFCVAES